MSSWVLLQLTPWAVKTKNTQDLVKAVRRYSSLRHLEFIYPVEEDQHGKYDSGYAEYAFLEWEEGTDYTVLEDTEEFLAVVRASPKDKPHLVSQSELDQILGKISSGRHMEVGDEVYVTVGALQGNYGKVVHCDGEYAQVDDEMGNETIPASLSVKWLKEKRPKGK